MNGVKSRDNSRSAGVRVWGDTRLGRASIERYGARARKCEVIQRCARQGRASLRYETRACEFEIRDDSVRI